MHETEITSTICAWVWSQIMPWRMRRPTVKLFNDEIRRLNATRHALSIYCIKGGEVLALERPSKMQADVAHPRHQMYLTFLQEILNIYPSIPDSVIALNWTDVPKPEHNLPVFCFQKRPTDPALLFPDIDFIGSNFYNDPNLVDPSSYKDKSTTAIFAGSTTGQINTVKTVRHPKADRLRAAKHFRGHPDVHFCLPSIVQCADKAAEKALRELGFGGNLIPWQDQYTHKFIISADGNGATCSRVVLGLRSNSALLKYQSKWQLYYFQGMQAWKHYIPIVNDDDIPCLITIERNTPGIFSNIANAGRSFAETYLTRERVMQYAAEILSQYGMFVYPEAPQRY